MGDLVSRAYVLAEYDRQHKGPPGGARKIMEEAPAVDAVPVVHGRWIDENPDDSLDPRMRCSICTGVESPLLKWRYCPNCGAKMDGERRDGDG